MGVTQREKAYLKLKRIYADRAFSNLALNDESPFVRRLVLGCIERKNTLEYIISRFARKNPDNELSALMHTGIYQILYMDVPDSAACNETAEIAKKLFGKHQAGFVNAILRSVCRNKQQLLCDIGLSRDSVKYSLHQSICDMLRNDYPADADDIMNSFFGTKRLFVRPNTMRRTAEETAKMLSASIYDGNIIECDDAHSAVKNIDSGDYFIQGIGSQTAVKWLEARPGMTVADVCACPGGKTFGAAIDMCGEGVIYASDIHKSKLSLIKKGARTLGVDKCIDISLCDARTSRAELVGKCDRVICDVPCTALGEIISRPEIRYKDIDSQSALCKTQADILDASSKLLAPGGRLVYSTCTLDKRENGDNVDRFLNENDGFELLNSHTFMPHTDGCGEGFYIALIARR